MNLKGFGLSILDKYILGKYVSTFIFTMAILSLIAVVFDVSERIEKFISKDLGWWQVTRDYYFNFIPWINSLLFPLYSLITVIFFTSRMADQTEIIPMLSSGISYRRFLRPFIIAATFFTLIHLLGNHIVVPREIRFSRTLKTPISRLPTFTPRTAMFIYLSSLRWKLLFISSTYRIPQGVISN
ncbi:MAG: LptF/LptG family permease [Saprospiraceae bacterium]|nr:LptF/LptG family permease [Candidatus Vicinibacter affinis]